MNKIDKALTIIYNNLPYKYHIPVKIYKTPRGLLQAEAMEEGKSYKRIFNYYTKYFNNPPVTNYIETKYYKSKPIKKEQIKNKTFTALDIAGSGSYPIKIVEETLLDYDKFEHIIFMLLHEIGHQVLLSGYNCDERACDLFAIRWIRKFVKQGILKKYWNDKK